VNPDGTKQQYAILKSVRHPVLISNVYKNIDKGWSPLGGLTSYKSEQGIVYHCQAMVKNQHVAGVYAKEFDLIAEGQDLAAKLLRNHKERLDKLEAKIDVKDGKPGVEKKPPDWFERRKALIAGSHYWILFDGRWRVAEYCYTHDKFRTLMQDAVGVVDKKVDDVEQIGNRFPWSHGKAPADELVEGAYYWATAPYRTSRTFIIKYENKRYCCVGGDEMNQECFESAGGKIHKRAIPPFINK